MTESIFEKIDNKYFETIDLSQFLTENFITIIIKSPVTFIFLNSEQNSSAFLYFYNSSEIKLELTKNNEKKNINIGYFHSKFKDTFIQKLFFKYVLNINLIQKEISIKSIELLHNLNDNK